ncbi:MAG: hypothetical protein IPJ03_02975 [Ignavibacteriales bacterium]|nr:hypothetical protein [Ignavibacteriales bacterium]
MAAEKNSIKNKPSWLPDIISVDGNWEEILERLYSIFSTDFIIGKPKLENYPVFWDRTIDQDDKYDKGFWHLVEREDLLTKERNFDPRRAERLPWCAPSIENCKDQIIKMWEYKEAKNKINIYLWLEQFDYVVIFQKRKFKFGLIAFLITAFYVDGNSKRRNLLGKYENRIV